MAGKQSKSNGDASSSRFSNFETDPRFSLPSKRQSKVKVDKRFSRMLKSSEFTETARVDRYGRKLKTDVKQKALQRLYQEDDDDDKDADKVEVEADDVVERELAKANARYDPARGGGFASSSESDSDSDSSESDEEGEEEGEGAVGSTAPDMQRYRTQQADVETGEVTNRFAVVNMDWDNVTSTDLMALFSSFAPNGGRILSVSVYPSEFGKERMQREEVEGPPKEIFQKEKGKDENEDEEEDDDSDSDEDSDEEAKQDLFREEDDKDFDGEKVRAYMLDRLRYYYAVIECSDKGTAQSIYEATDGTEYLSSSNFMDLRFIPDDVTFDDEPRDTCDAVPTGYKPIDFVTDALSHSRVKLRWDADPEEATRKETIKNAFRGSREDIAENELRAFLASGSEESDDEEEQDSEQKLSKKELARRKMRAALGLGDEPAPKPSKSAPVGDMQITFTPALTEDKPASKGKEAEETTVEKYIRKEREKKEMRREKAKARREVEGGEDAAAPGEDKAEDDLGFDDPFFTAEPVKATKTAIRKEERLKKREAREAEEAARAAEKAQLELLMAADDDDKAAHLDHFDMNEIMKAEKKKGKKKGKKGKKGAEEDGAKLQQDFQMDVADPRFKAVYESHTYAIDPSNPHYKPTEGMKKVLEEGRKRRKTDRDPEDEAVPVAKKAKKVKTARDDLGGLVESIKRKAKARG